MALDLKTSVRTGFSCPSCDCIYDNEDGALDCCSYDFTTSKTRYECRFCDKVYDEEDEAVNCCIDEWPVEEWIECTDCSERWRFGDGYRSREEAVEEARKCCSYAEEKDEHACDECTEWHETQSAAVACCHPVDRIIVYACTCGSLYQAKDDAARCCR